MLANSGVDRGSLRGLCIDFLFQKINKNNRINKVYIDKVNLGTFKSCINFTLFFNSTNYVALRSFIYVCWGLHNSELSLLRMYV